MTLHKSAVHLAWNDDDDDDDVQQIEAVVAV